MSQLTLPLILLLPGLPLAGALMVACVPAGKRWPVRVLGLLSTVAVIAVWLLVRRLAEPGQLLVGARWPWVEPLGVTFFLALDGGGLVMAGLVAVVGAAAVAATRQHGSDARRTVMLLLLAEAGMQGVICSWDLVLFAIFWEVALVPFFFIVEPGPARRGVSAATRLLVTSITSSVLMWVGILAVALESGRPLQFDLLELASRLQGTGLGGKVWLLVPSFLMRLAVVPLHTWFPTVLSGLPTSAAMLVIGGVVPLGGWGLWHVVGGLSPGELRLNADWLTWLGVASALAGACAALVQRDIKRLLAYSLLGLNGLLLCGLALAGAHQALWHLLATISLAGTGLALFAGVVCAARDSQRVIDLGGLWRSHPFFSGLAFACVAAVAAMPGTLGFVGVVGVLQEISGSLLAACLAAAGVVVAGMALLWAYRFVLGGSHVPGVWSTQRWPLKRQVVVLFLLAVLLLATGVMPGLVTPVAGAPSAVALLAGGGLP